MRSTPRLVGVGMLVMTTKSAAVVAARAATVAARVNFMVALLCFSRRECVFDEKRNVYYAE